jgi:hypothetical protein
VISALVIFAQLTVPANAHVVYRLQPAARAELWLMPGRAHLKMPALEIFWDLAKERRLDLFDGRSRDEPISFGRILQANELFPRGWGLPRHGQRRILGRSCLVYAHQQEVPKPDGSEKSSFSWCVWRGVPLAFDYALNVCHGHRCTRTTTRWKAVELTVGAVKDAEVARPVR